MSVKLKSSLFRDFLYLRDVVNCQQINAAAEKNGIKAANLSKLIKDLEALTSKKLFIRHSRGLEPTSEARRIACLIDDLEDHFNQLIASIEITPPSKNLKLCLPANFQLHNLDKYTKNTPVNITLCNNETEADVIVSYQPFAQDTNLITIENKIGANFSQTIWTGAVNTPNALSLLQFITKQLHTS